LEYIEFLSKVCFEHINFGLADSNFENRIFSPHDTEFWQGVSEALIAWEFQQGSLTLQPSRNGPDILIQNQGRKFWVEVICPEPKGLPDQWVTWQTGVVVKKPHEEILLRWTAAIKEKSEKLLGNSTRKKPGYLAKRVVLPDEAYIIAINSKLLRNGPWPDICGVSPYPYAVEAVFGIGPWAIQIDRTTLQQVDAGFIHRFTVPNASGAAVPANIFFDERFRQVSGILAVDLDGSHLFGNARPMAMIHNPLAVNPIPFGLLPVETEYQVHDISDGQFSLTQIPGSKH
jgi:type I restriction enzyme S subunit